MYSQTCVTSPGLAKTAHKHTSVHMYIDFNMTPFILHGYSVLTAKILVNITMKLSLYKVWIIIVGSYGQCKKLS